MQDEEEVENDKCHSPCMSTIEYYQIHRMVKCIEMKKVSKLKYYKTPLLVIFSFLLGCMVTINLVPIDKTCRIEDSDREYNIMKNSKLKNPELIVLILSAPKNLDKRNTIRETWLKLKDRGGQLANDNVKFKMKHYFVIGSLGLTPDQILHISSEQSRYSDILILPIYDNYTNLTQKVQKSFKWLNEQFEYGLGFKYVLKCDDDSFVRVDNLAQEIANFELMYLQPNVKHTLRLIEDTHSPFLTMNAQVNYKNDTLNRLKVYWGYFSGSAKVKTKGKWKEVDWMVCDRYIPYALGGGYILSKELVTYLAENSDNLRYFKSEDVSVGLWLSSVNNILRVHDIRFDTEWLSRGCQNFHLVTHNISTLEMRKMYDTIINTNKLCGVETLKRASYLYNWTLPPSYCCVPKKLTKRS